MIQKRAVAPLDFLYQTQKRLHASEEEVSSYLFLRLTTLLTEKSIVPPANLLQLLETVDFGLLKRAVGCSLGIGIVKS